MLDLDKISDIVFSGVDNGDYPDYSDAFVESAMYKDREMKEDELVELQDNVCQRCSTTKKRRQ